MPNQESIRSYAGLIFAGHFTHFLGACYPAHITALLRLDLARLCAESGFTHTGISVHRRRRDSEARARALAAGVVRPAARAVVQRQRLRGDAGAPGPAVSELHRLCISIDTWGESLQNRISATEDLSRRRRRALSQENIPCATVARPSVSNCWERRPPSPTPWPSCARRERRPRCADYCRTGLDAEAVARALHHRSARRSRPFVVLACDGASASSLEKQLIGGTQPGAGRPMRRAFPRPVRSLAPRAARCSSPASPRCPRLCSAAWRGCCATASGRVARRAAPMMLDVRS